MAEVSYGHIAIVPKGVWSSETQYEVGHLVEHDGSSYVVKTRPPVGTLPTDESYWQLSAKGTTVATGDIAGVVKGSDDITVGPNGELTVNTTFEQATELANLIAGEAIKEVLGKVSKAIATTMDLDQNALLKSMISGIDTNDPNKVPSSAFVHTLHERLGMGTALAAGDASDVTQAVNKLYSDLTVLNTNQKNAIIVKSFQSDSITVETKAIPWKITYTIPDGYAPIAWVLFYANSSEVILASEQTYSANRATIAGFARSINTEHSIKVGVTVTFIKKQYLSA